MSTPYPGLCRYETLMPFGFEGMRMWTGVVCGLLAGAMWGMVFIVPGLLPAFSAVELAAGRYTASAPSPWD